MTTLRRASDAWTAQPTYVQRQLLFAGIFVITVVGIPATGLDPSSSSALISSLIVLLATTVLTVVLPWRSWRSEWPLLIPLGSMLAVGLLRAATGESDSPYGFLIILPALAVGAEARSRWPVLLVALGCDMVVFLPYLVLANPEPASPELLLRALLTPFIASLAALAVHELTREVRARMASMRELQQEQEKLLLRTQHDADELAETGRALRGARDAFGSVIDAVTEQSIIATDQDGLISIFNPGAERLLGSRRADVVRRRNVTDFHLPAELAAVDEHGRLGLPALVGEAARGHAEVHDRTYVAEGGREIVVQQAVTPRYDSQNSVIGFLFVATDMTAAREVARLKDEFVSLISHELRTPLSSILGYLELVLDDEEHPLNPEQTQYLAIVERNAQRLLRLVGDLLFAAQVEAGKFAIEATEHAISGVGLGLSITRAIVLAHHGELDVHSVEGSGTTFTMRLPLREG